jgi:carboxyl-terminal processing protease
MALTLHLTDQAARHSQEAPASSDTLVAERCASYLDVWSLPQGGLGALVECEPAGVRLVTCLPGHAGLTSGLKVGDRITAIDGESTKGSNEAWAVSKLRGKIGSEVVLDVERGSGLWQRSFRVAVERQNIETEYSVYSRLRDGELVIKLMWLGPQTSEQLANHLNQISEYDVERVVLDLSSLSSGDVNSLRECASLFLPEGTTIGHFSTVRKCGEERNQITATAGLFTDKLTAVKVGPYTAKVGEVFARALVDQLGVEVEGSATAGLGTVDGRTIRSRDEARDCGMELFDSRGNAIDGNPLKPGFWSWSNLLSPVAAGFE